MDEDSSGPERAITIHADLALDLKIIASVILFGGYFTDQSPHRNSFVNVLAEWAKEHPFEFTPCAEPVTSSALIFMIAARINKQSTLELPIRFFESIDIMAIMHLSPDMDLRCRRIDKIIANEQWTARYGKPLSWEAMHILLPDLKVDGDEYPAHPTADAFRRTMQLVALQVLILLAFNDARIRKVMNRFSTEIEHEKRVIRHQKDRGISNMVEAAARNGASVEILKEFHEKVLNFMSAPDETR